MERKTKSHSNKGTLKRALPPDPEQKNDDRARWASAALHEFRALTGSHLRDALSDLLADLMHWCDRCHEDFDAELSRARYHYEAETNPDEEGCS